MQSLVGAGAGLVRLARSTRGVERLAPPWQKLEIVKPSDGIDPGKTLVMRMTLGPLWQTWVAEHNEYVEGERFRDVQVRGPFAHWEHTHLFTANGENASTLEDRIEYALPGGKWGRLLGARLVRRQLENVFRYRHRTTCSDLAAHYSHPGFTAMKILVTGSTGLVGSTLIPFLKTGGHHVLRLVRTDKAFEEPTVPWNPDKGTLATHSLEGLDAVVHLAGEGIANRRWSAAQKEKIRTSRVHGTKLLAIPWHNSRPPKTLVCTRPLALQ